jgi:hypothetical protein
MSGISKGSKRSAVSREGEAPAEPLSSQRESRAQAEARQEPRPPKSPLKCLPRGT